MVIRMIQDWGYPQSTVDEMVSMGLVSPQGEVLKPFWVKQVFDPYWEDAFYLYPQREKPGYSKEDRVQVYRVCPAPFPKSRKGEKVFYQEFGA